MHVLKIKIKCRFYLTESNRANLIQDSSLQCQTLFVRFLFVCLFVSLFGVFRPTWEFFETSPFPVKGCKFWPILGTYGHWAARVLQRTKIYCDTRHPFIMASYTHTYCQAFDRGAVTTFLNGWIRTPDLLLL